MFLIKEIILNNLEDNIKIVDGLKCVYIDGRFVAVDSFWGKSEVMVGSFADKTLFKPCKEDASIEIIPYTSECIVKDMEDGWKNIWFNVSTYETDRLEGYILIVKYVSNIKTDGEKLFGRYPTEIVVKLKNDNYIELANKRLEVINNKLCLIL